MEAAPSAEQALRHAHAPSALGGLLNAGKTGWLVGSAAPTYADFVLAEYLDEHLAFAPAVLCVEPPSALCQSAGAGACEELRAFHDRFFHLPAVAAYRKSEHFRKEPFHNRYSHFYMATTSVAGGGGGGAAGAAAADVR